MKTIKMNIVSLFWIAGLSWISLNGASQDIKLSRQERKEAEKAQMTANFYILDSLMNARSFVLEADNLQNQYGDRAFVASNINFIRVDKSVGVLQTGSDWGGRGYNGVGGVTAEGNIGTWKVDRDVKRLTYRGQFSLLTNIGHYDVFMVVSADGHASATISGMSRGKLTWDGHLETVNNSRVFKGQNTI
jgi:hypothetical protein